MTDIESMFEKFRAESSNFDRVALKPCKRPDLCAFILLDTLLPGNQDIISASEHDEIYLNIDINELAKVATEQDILTLVRCGVRYDSGLNCLTMLT